MVQRHFMWGHVPFWSFGCWTSFRIQILMLLKKAVQSGLLIVRQVADMSCIGFVWVIFLHKHLHFTPNTEDVLNP